MAIIYKPGLDEVRNRTGEGNLIPVYREMPADLETPVSVYLKLCVQGNGAGPSFLLESVEKMVISCWIRCARWTSGD